MGKIITIAIIILILVFLFNLIFIPILAIISGPGIVYGQFKEFLQSQDFVKHRRFDLKHFLFSWLVNLLGLPQVNETAVPHDLPFVATEGGTYVGYKVKIPFQSDNFFGAKQEIKKYDNYDRTFYYYPTFGIQNRDSQDMMKDTGYYLNEGAVFLVDAFVPLPASGSWMGNPVKITIEQNLVDLRTTIESKCVSVIDNIPTPLNELSQASLTTFIDPPDSSTYAKSDYIKQKFPPAPNGDPVVGTEGWIQEHIQEEETGEIQAKLEELRNKKESKNEYPYLMDRVAFVGGQIGAQISDTPSDLDPTNGWGLDNTRPDVKQRFVETFRFFPMERKHLTKGKLYGIYTIFATARSSHESKAIFTVQRKEEETDEEFQAKIDALTKAIDAYLEGLRKNPNFIFKEYVDGCISYGGPTVVSHTEFATQFLLGLFGVEDSGDLLKYTNFREKYFEYPIYFEIANSSRATEIQKGASSDVDIEDTEDYVAFYKEFSRREYDPKTEGQDSYVNPIDFMQPLEDVANPDQQLNGFEEQP